MDKCSFCGRKEKEVNILIAGVSGHICDNCIDQAHIILNEDKSDDNPFDDAFENLLKPKEMKKLLDEYVIGQDSAKKFISVAVLYI